MGRTRIALLLLALMVALQSVALAYQPGTLYSGVRSDEVKRMQEALISLGYLGGTPDGIYGTHTENAVKKFQKKYGLKADGVAGAKTLALIYQKAEGTTPAPVSTPTPAPEQGSEQQDTRETATQVPTVTAQPTQTTTSAGLFGGNYATLRLGASGSRVKILQSALIGLGYLKGSADGKFGKLTRQAVIAYQKANKLTADGLAGKKTLMALEKGTGTATQTEKPTGTRTAQETTVPTGEDPTSGKTATGPSGSQVKLLHWFNDIKPTLKSGQTLYLYEPSSGQGWNLRIYSCGRHCDAEPATAEDTASMLKAFGGVNTWSQKAVYVRLPNGTWTIGSTHDMPHMSGAVKDNNFNGHLCVHFLRTMSEAKQNDPNYGVANQNTIRAFWKSLTGEEITE